MDFGLSKYDLSVITRRVELPEVSADPAKPLTLIVRCADVRNRDFASNLFKYVQPPAVTPPAGELPAPPATDAPATETAIAPVTALVRAPDETELRRRLAELYAGSVVVGWENAVDSGGQAVPFSSETALELITQLMEHVPDLWLRVRDEVSDIARFRPAATIVNPVDLGKG